MNKGWIKLHRKFTEWAWYNNSGMVHLFIHFLISANSKDSHWNGIEVKRGQLITGRKKLSEITGLTEQQIRSNLSNLKSTSEITIKTTNKYSIITVCNYNDYQFTVECHQPADQPADQPTNNQQITTSKEVKNKTLYGIGENIKLSPVEYQKIVENLGDKMALDYIDRVSTWDKVGKSKSHYLTILNWWRRDGSPKPKTPEHDPDRAARYEEALKIRKEYGLA